MFGYDGGEDKLEHASYDRTCKRCGLIISIDHIDCPHCSGLSGSEMVTMLNNRITEEERNVSLGHVFIGISILLSVLLYFVF